MINLLTSRNVKFRKLGVAIKNFFNRTYIRTLDNSDNSVAYICFLDNDVFDKCLRAVNPEGVKFSYGS